MSNARFRPPRFRLPHPCVLTVMVCGPPTIGSTLWASLPQGRQKNPGYSDCLGLPTGGMVADRSKIPPGGNRATCDTLYFAVWAASILWTQHFPLRPYDHEDITNESRSPLKYGIPHRNLFIFKYFSIVYIVWDGLCGSRSVPREVEPVSSTVCATGVR